MGLITLNLKRVLNWNFIFMSAVAAIFGMISLMNFGDISENIVFGVDIKYFMLDGYLCLFIFFAGEISKDMLQQEKITKRIEWKLANGIKISRIALKKDNSLEQTMQIIKELVNNVYKHAAATFIHLEIALNEESRLVITCQNDGAKPNDIENILSSKGGMLFLTVLINGNGGNIQYLEKDGILTATAVLGRKNEDITI